MLSAWWLHLLDGIGQYVIRPGETAHIIMMTNNIMALGYTYNKCRLKNLPNIFCKISHIRQLIAWVPSILSWTPALRGRELSLLRPSFPKSFTRTNKQERPTVLTPLRGSRSGTQHEITPSIPTSSTSDSTNPRKRGWYRSQWHWEAH